MRSLHHLLALGTLAGALLGSPSPASAGDTRGSSIDYSVTIPDTKAEIFKVTATLRNISQDTLTFYFPIWAPGSYDIVNFGAFVRDFVATGSDGHPLPVARVDTNTFRITGARNQELRLVYDVHDIERLPNSLWFGLSDIEPTYAFSVGTALFGYPAGYKDIPYTVSYAVPNGWDIAIGLDPLKGSGRNVYHARNYDELVDAPLEMGKFQRLEFTSGGKPHIITVSAPKPLGDSVAKEFVKMTRRIVEIETAFFGGEMPYDRYVFQHYLVTPQPRDFAFGALEHANSSTYRMPYQPGGDIVEEMTPVVSHEYWHLWSPKRFHVGQLGPFDYQNPPRTKSLWFAEGLTEYYARLLLLRNGMISPEKYFEDINSYVTPSFGQKQGRSITELSMRISELGPIESAGLYSKGPVLGLLLDAAIRTQTGNRKSLDDAMRFFNQEYGKTGKTFTDEEIIPLIERATGAKLDEFYGNYIDGREALPYQQYLPTIGLKIVTEQEQKPILNAEVNDAEGGGWRVVKVSAGGTADSSGLRAGDILISMQFGGGGQGATVSLKDIPAAAVDQVLEQIPTYIPATVTLTRDGKEIILPVKYVIGTVEMHSVAFDDAASGQALLIRRSMFGS
jgi:predicted metalloprotease with PDZ domain